MTNSCPKTTHHSRKLLHVGRCLALVIMILVGAGSGVVWGAYSGIGTFTKITSLANLTDGYYVIVNSGNGFAMNNTYVLSTYLDKTAVTPSSNSITNPVTSIVWKIETNGSGKTIYNEATSKYISYTGSSNNVQVVDAVSANNQRWTFTYASSVFSATNLAVSSRILQYNASSPRFACYDSNQQKLLLYKLESSYSVSASSNNESFGRVSINGSVITATPATGYTYASPAYTVTGSATVVQNANEFTVTPTSNCNVQINFVAKPTYTLSLSNDGDAYSDSNFPFTTYEGNTITLPVLPDCGTNTFVGWDDDINTTSAPTYEGGDTYTTTAGNVTLYAVYSQVTGGAEIWTEVTNLNDIVAGTYVILNGSYFLPSTPTGSAGTPSQVNISTKSVSVSTNTLTGTISTDMKWDFTGTNSAMTIKSVVDISKYLYNINDPNGVRIHTTSSDTWAFETHSSGFAMKDANRSRYCAVSNSGNNWRSYLTKDYANYDINTGILEIYKKSGGSVTYTTTPHCMPYIDVTPISLSGFSSFFGNLPSDEQSFNVTGSNLTNDIIITAPANFEISKNAESGYVSTTLTLTQNSGSVATTSIYVRLKANVDFGNYTHNITLSSTGATSKTVTCSGTVSIADPVATAATSVTSNSFIANWNAVAGADGYKIDVYKKTGSYATDLIISEYIEGVDGNNKAIEIFNGTGVDVDLANYKIWLANNSAAWPTTPSLYIFGSSGTLAHNDVFVIRHSSADYANITSVSDLSVNLGFNGNDAVGLAKNISGNWTLIDAVGTAGTDPGTDKGWAVAGITDATLDKVLTRKGTVVSPTTDWETSRGTNTTDSEWIVQAGGADLDAAGFGSHSFSGGIVNTFLGGFENLTVTDTLKTVSGIAPNTEYYYVVRAYEGGNSSNNSNEIQHVHYWTGATSAAWGVATNWSNGVVPVTDATIWLNSNASNNCALDANRSVTDIVLKSTTDTLSANGYTLTIKGNIDYVGGAKIDATTSGSTVEFAGTASQTIGSNLFTSDSIYNLTISNAAGVVQNTDLTVSNVFTINDSTWYQINPAKLLTVTDTVTNLFGADGLFIRAGNDATANASFIYPQGQTVQATVEFYSKASWDKSAAAFSRYKWQYLGIPVSAGTHLKASPTFDGAFVRKFNETGVGAGISNLPVKRWLQLTNTSELVPFAGYEIVQAAATNYYIQGTLVNSNFSSGPLTYTTNPVVDTPGSHIFSNPYTAAIDIKQLIFGSETDSSVYQFHTGSHNDWGTNGTGTQELVGQYIVSPKSTAGNAGIPRYISSMQGFLIKKLHNDATNLSNFTFSIPYTSVKVKNTTAMRSSEQEKSYTTIDVVGNRFADKVWIFIDPNCSRAYDNGWDGRKLLGSVLTPQLLIREAQNDLQISAVDNINNTVLAFQPGEDAAYTLTFKHTNIVYPELYLLDAETNSVTDISATGSTYNFIATASTTPVERFKIVTGSNITTDNADIKTVTKIFSNNNIVFVNNKSNCAGTLKLMDITGKMLLTKSIEAGALTSIETGLVAGNYIALFENCERAFRQTILLK